MKLGAAGLLGAGSPDAVRAAAAMGFRVLSWHHPAGAGLRSIRETGRLLRDAGITLCQVAPPDHPPLVSPDRRERQAGIDAIARALEIARELNAENVYVRPGSLSRAGAWTPHPGNRRSETLLRLAESLRDASAQAEQASVSLAIEGHVVSPLHSAAAMRQMLDVVGSPWLRVNLDPVNLVGSLEQAYDTTALLREMYALLGSAAECAHAKDLRVADRLVLHIDECPPGEGILDWPAFLRGYEECRPDGVVLIEHLDASQLPAARKRLLALAAAAGVPFEEGD